MPIAAVIGRSDIMGLYPPGSMTSTHSASPLPTIAALANIEILKDESLLRHVREMGAVLDAGLQEIKRRYLERV
ncbi:MAG: aminotransferase class III-fold pyridoxal phosphate-dependent enzyme, partial [Pirellulaceae bacterium]